MYIEKTTVKTSDKRDLLVEQLESLSESELLALCLMSGTSELIGWACKNYDRSGFMAALDILERYSIEYPDDAECQAAIEFIRENFQ